MQIRKQTSFGACKFRGFHPSSGKSYIILRHKKIPGIWVYGSYLHDQNTRKHYIENSDGRFDIIADTVGMQDPISHRWPGDTCFHSGVRGVVRFGYHTTTDHTVDGYYIEWLSDRPETKGWHTNILYWSSESVSPIVWAGTLWDPIAEFRHFLKD